MREYVTSPFAEPNSSVTGRNPVTRRQRLLCELVADLLRVSDVGLDDGFVALGGDSIIAMQLVSRARKAGLRITVGDVLSHRDMEALAEAATTVDREPAPVADDGVGPVAATPVMRWFRERGGGVDTYNQFAVLRTPPGLTETRLVSMVQACSTTTTSCACGCPCPAARRTGCSRPCRRARSTQPRPSGGSTRRGASSATGPRWSDRSRTRRATGSARGRATSSRPCGSTPDRIAGASSRWSSTTWPSTPSPGVS